MEHFNSNFDSIEIYEMLIKIGSQYGVDPSLPIESESYFRNLLANYSGNLDFETLENWLHEQIRENFIALDKRPLWIQGAEWPIDETLKPMIFVGQIDVTVTEDSEVGKYLHDTTSFYLFLPQNKGNPKIIVQQF